MTPVARKCVRGERENIVRNVVCLDRLSVAAQGVAGTSFGMIAFGWSSATIFFGVWSPGEVNRPLRVASAHLVPAAS
jgi:hypothetical protein